MNNGLEYINWSGDTGSISYGMDNIAFCCISKFLYWRHWTLIYGTQKAILFSEDAIMKMEKYLGLENLIIV